MSQVGASANTRRCTNQPGIDAKRGALEMRTPRLHSLSETEPTQLF